MKKFYSLLSITLISSALCAQQGEFNTTEESASSKKDVSDKYSPSESKGSISFDIESEFVVAGVSSPTTITNAGDERLFVTEQSGAIRIFDRDGNLEGTPFMDISDRVQDTGGEQGLLGLAFEENFCVTGRFYVNYTANDGGLVTRISRFNVLESDPVLGDPNSEEILIQFDQDFGNHNGGHIEFGADGFLYIATGDGGSGGDPNDRAQDITSFLGKILRIDVSPETGYTVPEDNPFAFDDFGVDEIWSYGWRNPWKFAFDSETGGMYAGDVGQNAWEEVNFEAADAPPGLNYGWRCYEGNNNFDLEDCSNDLGTYVFPIEEYNHNSGGFSHCSITGGRVYRGISFESFNGWYFYTDFCSGAFWAVQELPNGDVLAEDFGTIGQSFIRTFGEDAWGEVYFANNNGIYRLTDPDDELLEPVVQSGDLLFSSITTGSFEWLLNGLPIAGADDSFLQAQSTGTYTLLYTPEGSDCPVQYSIEVTVLSTDESEIDQLKLFPNPTTGMVVVDLESNFNEDAVLSVYSIDGRVVKELRTQNDRIELDLSDLSKGVYMVQLSTSDNKVVAVSKVIKD